jgi:hypothetical protein
MVAAGAVVGLGWTGVGAAEAKFAAVFAWRGLSLSFFVVFAFFEEAEDGPLPFFRD